MNKSNHPTTDANTPGGNSGVVHISSPAFVLICALVALIIAIIGWYRPIPVWVVAVEVFLTILSLFVFGSIRYRIHKNALTYGMVMVIITSFFGAWWPTERAAEIRAEVQAEGLSAWGPHLKHHLLTFHGLDHLVHLDTMLFILGLTFFVSVIAQTRLLETLTFFMLRKNRGNVLPTVLAVTAVVSFASGILDGVSMIGLTIRTLVIILALAAAPTAAIRNAVMICTVVTTVCGMWLAYGEPPNLIMKANVLDPTTGKPLLTDAFFLRYCLPAAVCSYFVVAWTLRSKLRGTHVALEQMDVLDTNVATIRFLQATRHGEVYSPIEFLEEHKADLQDQFHAVLARVREGESLGQALVREQVPKAIRSKLLGGFTTEDLAEKLDHHYELEVRNQSPGDDVGETAVKQAIHDLRHRRVLAARVGAAALIPFVGLLVVHALNHHVPLFLASFAGFGVALTGIYNIPNMRKLALREAFHEYAEYYFLFPLFLSITLLSNVGFFDQLQTLLREGIDKAGASHIAWAQFTGATILSAMLDNNVVADFASRAILGLETATIHLFAMAQIAGYAAGGCLTHIGSAQSVVAYAFILRTVDEEYTPLQWVREMAPLGIKLFIVLTILIYAEGSLHGMMG